MAADLNFPFDGETETLQILQYVDDSLEAWFKDGSHMALSACGAAFTHRRTKVGSCGRLTPDRVHQYTQFVVSEFREKLSHLLKFRNYFSERPFLCQAVIDDPALIQSSSIPIHYASWPKTVHKARQCFSTTSDGHFQLSAVDGHAVLRLAPHSQTFEVSYLAHVPMANPKTAESSQDLRTVDCCYVWTREIHSVLSFPECWRHPFSLLLQWCREGSLGEQGTDNKENEPEQAVTSTLLPHSLPLTCPHTHLHQTKQQAHKPVKVWFSEGIVYRVYHGGSPWVEMLPSRATLLRSRDPSGRFFSCWTATTGGTTHEHVYCVDQPPPSSVHAQSYSLARVMGRAKRMLGSLSKLEGVQSPVPCWKDVSNVAPPLPRQLECVHVPGLARLSASTNGHIRVVFADRTALDMFSPSLASTGQGSISLGRGAVLEAGRCRLLLPNGRYHMVATSHPMQFERYVKVALDWCQWLSLPTHQRGTFYGGTVYDPNARRAVLAEIEKIQSYDWILSGGGSDDKETTREEWVEEVLRRNKAAVQGIDSLLQK